MNQSITVQVYDIIGGPLCVSAEDGQRLYEKTAPLLRDGRPVEISFERVDTMIAAFLNAAVGQLYGEPEEETVDKLLSVSHLPADGEEVLQHVIENAKTYFRSPVEFDRAWQDELGDEIDEE